MVVSDPRPDIRAVRPGLISAVERSSAVLFSATRETGERNGFVWRERPYLKPARSVSRAFASSVVVVLHPEQAVVHIGGATPPSAPAPDISIQCAHIHNAALDTLFYVVGS